ncbi:MAG: universal stress protein [Elusimicrobia bacterium]|nr:universal stress protein [Elusimicrobiota bacterium]
MRKKTVMFEFPPKSILVGMDESEPAKNAWLHARYLAQKFGAALEAIHVQPLLTQPDFPYYPSYFMEQAQGKALEEVRSWIGPATPMEIAAGDPMDMILKRAKTRRNDLIVMGTHGRKGFDRAVLGSVAEGVVHRSPIPVLVVKRKPATVKSLLAPVNFAPYSDFAFKYAAQVAGAFRVKATVFHVASNAGQLLVGDHLTRGLIEELPQAQRNYCAAKTISHRGNPIEDILVEARRHQLVVVSAHRKFLIQDIVLGTTAERVLRHSPVPVLAVPTQEAAIEITGRPGRSEEGKYLGRSVPVNSKAASA